MRKTITACAVTALAVGGTTATAASLITGKDIADQSILNRDIKEGTVSLNRLTPGVQALVTRAGTPGRDGAKGETGAGGAPGAPGAVGAAGAAGSNGIDGKDGKDGLKGDKGDKGDPGRDASSARPVTADDLQGWHLAPKGDNGSTTDNGTLTFEQPPVTAPLGAHALKMVTSNGKNVAAYVPLPEGTAAPFAVGVHPRLSELTTASYTTLSNASPADTTDVSFQIEVTGASIVGSATGYSTVVYEPYVNGQLADGAFHRHNVRAGKVWATRVTGECSQASPCTMSRFMELHPLAVVQTIKLRIGQNSGEGWNGFVGFVDDVRLGFDGDFVRYDLGA